MDKRKKSGDQKKEPFPIEKNENKVDDGTYQARGHDDKGDYLVTDKLLDPNHPDTSARNIMTERLKPAREPGGFRTTGDSTRDLREADGTLRYREKTICGKHGPCVERGTLYDGKGHPIHYHHPKSTPKLAPPSVVDRLPRDHAADAAAVNQPAHGKEGIA